MKVPLTIGDFLRRGAAVYADRPAVFDEPGAQGSLGTVSYRQLASRARGMALALDELGVAQGERVAIVSPNAARFQIACFGVSGYGRVLVPINYRLNADEISYIVEHSGASVLLVDPESDKALQEVARRRSMVLEGEDDAGVVAEAPAGAEPAPWAPDEDATASINYTSGTTARPKGVELTHRNCWLNAAVFGWHTAVTDRDVFLHTLPMFHCNGWGMPYAVTGMGVPQVVVRKTDGEEILRRIGAHGVTLLCGAPAVVAAILNAASDRRDRRVGRPGSGRAGEAAVAGRRPSRGRADPGRPDRRGAGQVQPCLRRVLAATGGVGARAGRRVVPHRRRGPPRGWRLPGDIRPEEGRHHLRRRERQLGRGGGLPLPARGGGRGGRHRGARRSMGRDGQGAGRSQTGP